MGVLKSWIEWEEEKEVGELFGFLFYLVPWALDRGTQSPKFYASIFSIFYSISRMNVVCMSTTICLIFKIRETPEVFDLLLHLVDAQLVPASIMAFESGGLKEGDIRDFFALICNLLGARTSLSHLERFARKLGVSFLRF
jgi:hypothetical protein